MLENFNGPVYLILFIVLLLANLYYAYSTLINTKVGLINMERIIQQFC